MGTDQHTLATLNTHFRIPNRHFEGNIAFFPLRGAGGIGAINRHRAHGQQIAVAGNHHRRHALDKVRCGSRHRRNELGGTGDAGRDFYFV